jgi:hypothetical protein
MDASGSPDADALDAALVTLHGTDVEFAGGLSNHGPMAAEALEAMGHADRIAPFVADYGRRLEPSRTAEPLPRGEWPRALGRVELRASLVASFIEELRVDEPRDRSRVPRRAAHGACVACMAAGAE